MSSPSSDVAVGRGKGAGLSLFTGLRATMQRHPRGDGSLIISTKSPQDGWDAYLTRHRVHIPDLLEVRTTPEALRILGHTILELADEMDSSPTSPA